MTTTRARLLVTVAFLALAVPVTFFVDTDFAAALDERIAHYPTVQAFAAELPFVDLSDYPSSTGPLYHLALAVVVRIAGDHPLLLRAINLALGVLCILVAHAWFARRMSAGCALLAAAIFGFTPYVFSPSTRLMTENPSFLLTLLALGLLVDGRFSRRRVGWLTVVLTAAVAVRQTNVWLVLLAAFVLWRDRVEGGSRGWWRWLPVVMPVAILGVLGWIWGGPVPPSQEHMDPRTEALFLNVVGLIFAVSLLGAYGLFFSWSLGERFVGGGGDWRVLAGLTILSLGVLAAVPYAPLQGVSPGPLDQLALRLPVVLGVPVVLLVLLPLGCWVFYVAVLTMRAGDERLLVAAYGPWLLCMLLAPVFYQRHFEPFTVFFLLAVAMPVHGKDRRALVGPGLLLGMLVAVAVVHHMVARVS